MVTEMAKKHVANLLKTEIVAVFTNLANQVLREMTSDTMESIAADIRRLRHHLNEHAAKRRHTDAKQKGLWKPTDPWYDWWSIAGSNR